MASLRLRVNDSYEEVQVIVLLRAAVSFIQAVKARLLIRQKHTTNATPFQMEIERQAATLGSVGAISESRLTPP